MPLNKPLSIILFALLLVISNVSAQAQIQPSSLPMETVLEGYSVPAGTLDATEPEAVVVTLTLTMEEDWYTYSDIPTELGKPTKLTATAADGTPLAVFYPTGTDKPDPFDADATIKAYKSGTKLFVLVPRGMEKPFPLALRLDLLLCHPTKCVPARLELAYGNGVNHAGLPDATSQPWWDEFNQLARQQDGSVETIIVDDKATISIIDWQFTPTYLQPGLEVTSLLSAVLMGLLAGLILNIMPCVLPVVSLKLSALLGSGGNEDEAHRYHAFREHNIYFVLGILSFFLFLAVVLGATGSAWGALFQNRWLVLGVAGIVGALGASLFGLFHLPVIDLKFDVGHTNPRKKAFFTGMLTTLLATPCSGPFLGGVLSWALIQGPVVIATIFIAIGLGMSAPYLLLVLNPSLSRFLPKSGPWIEYVEKGIAFFLLATAFYLVAIAVGTEYLRILAPLWVVMFGGWLWLRTRTASGSTRWGIRAAVILLLAGAVIWTTPPELETNPWESFDPVTLNQDIGKEALFVEFTADWCPTCKVLEATVMTDENVARWKKEFDIRFIKVDMTERDPDTEALLQALGSRSIPTAALFRAGERQNPLVLRDLFTVKQIEKILKSL